MQSTFCRPADNKSKIPERYLRLRVLVYHLSEVNDTAKPSAPTACTFWSPDHPTIVVFVVPPLLLVLSPGCSSKQIYLLFSSFMICTVYQIYSEYAPSGSLKHELGCLGLFFLQRFRLVVCKYRILLPHQSNTRGSTIQ